MGIFDVVRKQFIEVIQWTEEEDGVLAYRYPMRDKEIQNGAQLTVRETQAALFLNEGETADLFGPGHYTLTTKTLPILTSLRNWDKLFQSPFKSDVTFFSTREQINQKWGTANPVTLRDKELGPLRLRAHGSYSYKIKAPKVFFEKISGTRELYRVADLDGQLRAAIVTSIATALGGSEAAFIDMAASQTKFSDMLKAACAPAFESYGLALQTFFVQSISLPEELQGYFDKMASIRMVGDLQKYAQFQAADSLPAAASQPGGLAGAGASLGMGAVLGQTLGSALNPAMGTKAENPEDAVALLGKLHDLVQKGVLTQAEFEAKKAELLKKIT